MVATAWQEGRMCDGGHVYVLGTVPIYVKQRTGIPSLQLHKIPDSGCGL